MISVCWYYRRGNNYISLQPQKVSKSFIGMMLFIQLFQLAAGKSKLLHILK